MHTPLRKTINACVIWPGALSGAKKTLPRVLIGYARNIRVAESSVTIGYSLSQALTSMPSGWAPWGLISRVSNSSCLTAIGVFGCGGVGHWYARSHNRACRLHFLCQQRPLTCRYKKPVIDRFFFVKLERNQSVSKARVKRDAVSVPVAHERH